MTYEENSQIFTASDGAFSETSFSIGFRLQDLVSVDEFKTLFDQYRIRGALVRIQMVNNPNATYRPTDPVTESSNTIYPRLLYTPDFDDIGIMTRNEMREYATTKERILMPNRDIKIFIRPRTRVDVHSAAGGVPSLTPSRYNWIDMATDDINYYGLKCCIDYNGTNTSNFTDLYKFKVETKLYFQCKTPR